MASGAPVGGARRTWLIVAVTALVAGLVGGGVANAGLPTPFNDIQGNPFENEIVAIYNAGITTGYPDGTFRPGQDITRGAMAAFMSRGFGRIGFAEDSDTAPADGATTTGAIAQLLPGTRDTEANGFALVTATAEMRDTEANCPCRIELEIVEANSGTTSATRTSMSDDVAFSGTNVQSVTVQDRFVMPGDQAASFRARFRVTTSGGNNSAIVVATDITAVYAPFDGNGGSG